MSVMNIDYKSKFVIRYRWVLNSASCFFRYLYAMSFKHFAYKYFTGFRNAVGGKGPKVYSQPLYGEL